MGWKAAAARRVGLRLAGAVALAVAGCTEDAAPAAVADVQVDAGADLAVVDVAVTPSGAEHTFTSGSASLRIVPGSLRLELSWGKELRTVVDLAALQLGRVDAFDPTRNYAPTTLDEYPVEDLRFLKVTGAAWTEHAVAPPPAQPAPPVPTPSPAGPGVSLRLTTTDGTGAGPEFLLHIDPLPHGTFRADLRVADPALREAWAKDQGERPLVEVGLGLQVSATEAFYGLGEWFDTPEHRGKKRAMHLELSKLDGSSNEAHVVVPFLIGTNGWGAFVESLRPGLWDVAASKADRVVAMYNTSSLRFFLFAADKPLDVISQYTRVTGSPKLPAKWAFGGLLWRDENESQQEVLDDVAAIRKHDLALSGMWIDRPYDTHVNNFGWNPKQFPDPKAMIDTMHANGLRVGLWSTPYVEEGAKEHQQVVDKGWYVKAPPAGKALFKWGPPLDFTNPDVTAFWKGQIAKQAALGIEGWKLDYGEDIQLGIGSLRLNYLFADGSDERTMHHAYAYGYHKPYADSLPKDGGWLLNRSGTFGDQVHTSIVWPGDLCANWTEHGECTEENGKETCHAGGLPASVSAVMSLPASGFPFFGADTGGYRHGRATKELFLRWLGHTALSAILQVGGGSQHNPWDFAKYGDSQFDQEVLDAARVYFRLHLRLFPYIYADAVKASAHEGPGPVRAFGLMHPELAAHVAMAAREKDQYYLGDSLLVAPITTPGGKREVLLPKGVWIDWWTGERVGSSGGPMVVQVQKPATQVPLYILEGGVVFLLTDSIDTLAPAKVTGIQGYDPLGHQDVTASLGASATVGSGSNIRFKAKPSSDGWECDFYLVANIRLYLKAKPASIDQIIFDQTLGRRIFSMPIAALGATACTPGAAPCWSWNSLTGTVHLRWAGPVGGKFAIRTGPSS